MNTNNTPTPADEITYLKAALEVARKRGPKLSAVKRPGKHLRAQLFLSRAEHASIGLVTTTLSWNKGQEVSRALTMRLALARLVTDVTLSLKDKALAARMNAELDAVRAETAP